MSTRPFHIALSHHSRSIAQAATFLGLHDAARSRLDWEFVRPRGSSALTIPQTLAARPDGVIGAFTRPAQLAAVRRLGVPVVCVNPPFSPPAEVPAVFADNVAAGRAAAAHLLERGFSHFAFVREGPAFFAAERRAGFARRLAEAGREFADLPGPTSPRLAGALRGLAKPAGVFCQNDLAALAVMRRCRELGLQVPDEIALVGVDNDEFLCVDAPVPLTSVDMNLRAVGARAVEMLARLLQGRAAPRKPVLVAPTGVISRRSSHALHADDPLVRRALLALEGREPTATVEALASRLRVSRRTLERRFREGLGRSPHQELLHRRVLVAKELLRSTRLSIAEIVERAGFADERSFYLHFRSRAGISPRRFRLAES